LVKVEFRGAAISSSDELPQRILMCINEFSAWNAKNMSERFLPNARSDVGI
jgi:hypothetical protein